MDPLLVATLAFLLQGSSSQIAFFEDFDEPGSTWAATIFPEEHVGGAAFTREPLSVGQGAPNTSPPLPINAGGDLEGRFSELTVAGSSFALSTRDHDHVFSNGGIRGFAAFGVTSSFGSQEVGFLLRARINPSPPFGSGLNAYTAYIFRSGTSMTTATLSLARWRDGVITSVFASATFPIDVGNENYLLEFQVEGPLLAARLWRVTAIAGRLSIDPVPLGQGTGSYSNLLLAEDSELDAGRPGLWAFTRSTNSVFWEDILVKRSSSVRRLSGSSTSAPFRAPPWRGLSAPGAGPRASDGAWLASGGGKSGTGAVRIWEGGPEQR